MRHTSHNFLLILAFIFTYCINLGAGAITERAVPAIYIFGDSSIDVGTNVYVQGSYARANFLYNGIDLPKPRPTGRFSNGYNIGDQLAMKLGFHKSPPAFLYLLNHSSTDYFKRKVQRGVNFASAGAGIFYETGQRVWNGVVPLEQQIQQFATVKANMTQVRGAHGTEKVLAKALYIFCIGSNDFLDYMRNNSTLPKEQLMGSLQSLFHGHLKNVYNLGARKFAFIGVPPIGCIPYSRLYNEKQGGGVGCKEQMNDFAQTFHNLTLALLHNMTSELPQMKYSLGNTYAMTTDMFDNYTYYGFKEFQIACCGSGKYNGGDACYEPFGPNLCPNRSEYIFWDLYHPSQAASQLLADNLYGGGLKYMIPMNFSQLAEVEVHI